MEDHSDSAIPTSVNQVIMFQRQYALLDFLRLGVFIAILENVHAKRELGEYKMEVDPVDLQTHVEHPLDYSRNSSCGTSCQLPQKHDGQMLKILTDPADDSLLQDHELYALLQPRQHKKAIRNSSDDLKKGHISDGLSEEDRTAVKTAAFGKVVLPEVLNMTCPKDIIKKCGSYMVCHVNTISHRFDCQWAKWLLTTSFVCLVTLGLALSLYVCFPNKEFAQAHLDEVTGKAAEMKLLSTQEKDGRQMLASIAEQRSVLAYQIQALNERIQMQKKIRIAKQKSSEETGKEGADLDCDDPEEMMQAGTQALVNQVVPHLLFAKQCQHAISNTQARIYDKSAAFVKKQTDEVFLDTCGLPHTWADGWDGFDPYPLMLMIAGLLAPFQLTLTWAISLIIFSFRAMYLITVITVLYREWNLPCIHASHAEQSVSNVKTWLIVDMCITSAQIICKIPIILLARQAVLEIQRPESTFTNWNDPMQCLKEAIMDDTLYSGFAVYRYDQICSARGVGISRWITYVEFIWCWAALYKAWETPSSYCAAIGMLRITEVRACLFLVFMGISACGVVISIFSDVMEQSDSIFASVLEATSEFDKQYSITGFPLTTLLVRAFVARDSTNMHGAQERVLQHQLAFLKSTKNNERDQQQEIAKEMRRVDKDTLKISKRLEKTLDHQMELEREYENKIKLMAEQAKDVLEVEGKKATEQAMKRLQEYDPEAYQKLVELEEEGEHFVHDIAETGGNVEDVLQAGLHTLEEKAAQEKDWLMSEEGQAAIAGKAARLQETMTEAEDKAMKTVTAAAREGAQAAAAATEDVRAQYDPEGKAMQALQEQKEKMMETASAAQEKAKKAVDETQSK